MNGFELSSLVCKNNLHQVVLNGKQLFISNQGFIEPGSVLDGSHCLDGILAGATSGLRIAFTNAMESS
jgi:hypothetical protein